MDDWALKDAHEGSKCDHLGSTKSHERRNSKSPAAWKVYHGTLLRTPKHPLKLMYIVARSCRFYCRLSPCKFIDFMLSLRLLWLQAVASSLSSTTGSSEFGAIRYLAKRAGSSRPIWINKSHVIWKLELLVPFDALAQEWRPNSSRPLLTDCLTADMYIHLGVWWHAFQGWMQISSHGSPVQLSLYLTWEGRA